MFTQTFNLIACIVQSFFSFFKAILQQSRDIFGFKVGKSLAGVVRDRLSQRSEQIFVINDVAKFFIIPIKPIDATDRLEQAVILHLLINVKISSRWCIKTGEKFVYHDEKFHLRKLFNEILFDCFLKFFSPTHNGIFRLIEIRREHFSVGVIFLLSVSVVHRVIGGNDSTFPF